MSRRYIRGHVRRAEEAGVVDSLVHKRTLTVKGKTHDCCKDPSNLTLIVGDDEYANGKIIEVCRYCNRRHIRMRAGEIRWGMEPTPLGRKIFIPTLKMRKELRI